MAPDDDISIPGLKFPSPYKVARERAEEFRRMSPKERMAALADVLATGLFLLRHSPKRELLDKLFLEREEEWQRIQKELFRHADRSAS